MFVLMLSLGIAANAQSITSGTVDFSVTVLQSFDLRANGAATGSGITASPSQNANDPLAVILSVADASPNTNNATLTAAVPIRMRSNFAYKLQATRVTQDAVSPADFDSSDIGMSLAYNARSGAQVASGNDTPANGFGAPGNTVGTLSATPLTISNGDRISNQGNNLSNDNFVGANLNFSVARQYYTPGTFTQQVVVSISAQP